MFGTGVKGVEKDTMRQSQIKDFLILYFAFFIYSFVSVCAKLAAGQATILGMLLFMGIEICLLGIYAIIWQQALKRFPLVVAMSSKGITVILSLIWAILFFHEQITLWNMVGAGMIILGIGLVSADN